MHTASCPANPEAGFLRQSVAAVHTSRAAAMGSGEPGKGSEDIMRQSAFTTTPSPGHEHIVGDRAVRSVERQRLGTDLAQRSGSEPRCRLATSGGYGEKVAAGAGAYLADVDALERRPQLDRLIVYLDTGAGAAIGEDLAGQSRCPLVGKGIGHEKDTHHGDGQNGHLAFPHVDPPYYFRAQHDAEPADRQADHLTPFGAGVPPPIAVPPRRSARLPDLTVAFCLSPQILRSRAVELAVLAPIVFALAYAIAARI